MLKSSVFYLLMLGFILLVLEGFSFAAVQLTDTDNLFDTRATVYARFSEAGLAQFRKIAGDPVTGWRNRGPRTIKDQNCLGEPVSYSYDEAAARLHDRFDAVNTRVVVVGDSYTNGEEVGDNQTYPARLSALLRTSVANHGVGGYGPVQSILNLQQKIARYPEAEIVVLGIMYENLYRMMNSYRPALYNSLHATYSLKPYMKDGNIVPHPGVETLASIDAFRQAADYSYNHDFWARPVLGFPYLASIVRGLGSNHFYFRKFQREFRKIGKPEYFLTFTSREIELNLIALLNHYAQTSQDMGLQPVVIFIPRNAYDTVSASGFIERNRSAINPGVLLGNVGETTSVDWEQYNLREAGSDNTCHPSPMGYEVIADYIAALLQAHGISPNRH